MGFTRWGQLVANSGANTVGWTPSNANSTTNPDGSDNANGIAFSPSISAKLGVMFLGTDTGTYKWDQRTSTSSIVDGSSTTILASENFLAGASAGHSSYTGTVPITNWACPHPNYMGFIASDTVFTSGMNLSPTMVGGIQSDGAGWALANTKNASYASGISAMEAINYGINLSDKGTFPFPLSNHNNGINMLFCDGSLKFVNDTIDGTVYSKLITPQGSKLPGNIRQLPVDASAID